METLNLGDELVLELSDGTCRRGRRHSYWAFLRQPKEHRLLSGKLSDLKSPSEQLARRSAKSSATVIGVRIPALSSFLADRMAKALRVISARLFGLLVCYCYDDSPGGEVTLEVAAQQTL
jgi:hypothetical protein